MRDQVSTIWRHGFVNFEDAFTLLRDSLINAHPSIEERQETIQFFKMTFELGWKLMRDYLAESGSAVETVHDIIKKSYESDIIKKGDIWMQALNDSLLNVEINESEITGHKSNPLMTEEEEDLFNRIQYIYLPEFHDFHAFFRKKFDAG